MSERTVLVQCLQDQRHATKPLDTFESKMSIELHNIGIKNLLELEGIIDSQDSCVSFLNRSIPFFPKEKVSVKPKEQKLLVLEVPFIEEISGMAITKMLDIKEQKTLTMKLKFIRNRATSKVTNSTQDTVTFDPKEMLGVVALRSLGYYKIKQGVLQ